MNKMLYTLLSNNIIFCTLLIVWSLSGVIGGIALFLFLLMKRDVTKALHYYCLKKPFTQQELEEKKRILIKTVNANSDDGIEEIEKINQYYDLLKDQINK